MSASDTTSSGGGCFSNLGEKIIKWTPYFIYFSQPAFFVKGLFFAHGFVQNAVLNQFVYYLSSDIYWGMSLTTSAAIINAIDGVEAILLVITTHLREAYFDEFIIIIFTTAAYTSALVLLLASTIGGHFFQSFPVTVFCLALVLLALGDSGLFPLEVFLADQIADDDEEEASTKEEKVDARTQFWRVVAKFIGSTISAFFVVQKSWMEIFWTSAVVMGAALFLFLCGTYFGPYKYVKPTGSPLTTAYRVFKAALSKRHLDYPHSADGYYFLNNEKRELQISPVHPILRWIDRAAIIEPSSSAGSQESTNIGESSSSITHESEKNLSSVEEVKKVKRILTLFPLWTTFLVYSLVQATGNTIFLEQSVGLDFRIADNKYEVPFNAFFILRSSISSITTLSFYFLIPKRWRVVRKRRAALVRVGVGMVISVLFCLVSWWIEVRRLRLIQSVNMKKLTGDFIQIPMSIFWLTPQFIMLGLMDGLVDNGLGEFYDNYVDESMKFFRNPINWSVLAIQRLLSILFVEVVFRNWIQYDTLGESHLDKYFLMLAILSGGNLCFHALVSYKYTGKALQQEESKGERPQREADMGFFYQ